MTTQIKSLLMVVFILAFFTTDAQIFSKKKSKKDTHNFRYEIECIGEGKQGTYSIKVFSYSKKPKVAIEAAKRNAVHGIIFKGISGGQCINKPALARNPNLEQEKADFFKAFFANGGKYSKFVVASTDGAIEAGDVTKVSKKEYKIGVNVSVNVALLRKDLEAAGIIKGLGSMF
jgi:hypothetical protein